MEAERRINGNGRRQTDEYCPMHESLVNNQKEIRAGFKWLIGLHIGEYGVIIAALIGVIYFLLDKNN